MVGDPLVWDALEQRRLELTSMDRADDTISPAATALASRSAVRRVLLLACVLAGGAAAFTAVCMCVTEALRPAPWWIAFVIAAGFAVAERYVFHIEYRSNAISFSLSEVPTAFALVFLGPIVAIVVRVVGSLAGIAFTARPARYKLVFNAALFAFEIAFAAWFVRTVASPDTAGDARILVAVSVAVTVATLAGSIAVTLAIASFEGDVIGRFLDEVRTSAITAPVGAIVGIVAIAPSMLDWRLGIVSLVPVVAVWLVLLSHGRISQRHADLEDVHAFSSAVAGSLDLGDLVPTALSEAMRLLRASSGLLQVFDDDGTTRAIRTAGPRPLKSPPIEQLLSTSVAGSPHGAVDTDPATLVIAVRDVRGVVGVIVLADRVGTTASFSDDDRRRAHSLGDQLAVGLRNALLHAGMEHAANHDALTTELNRAGFEHIADAELARPRSGCVAVMMLDLDRFKEVNDTLGHAAGDAVLCEIARRIRAVTLPDDILARFGGDEFALLVRRDDITTVRDVAERILFESHAPLPLDGFTAVVTLSIGVAAATDDDHDTTSLLRRADIAMYTAKRAHTGVELYRDEIDRRTPERLSLLGDLRHAIEHDCLDVHFQPKIEIATNTVIGAEALVRWHHPTRGWVNPIDFITLAEETGLIRLITDRVLELALTAAHDWTELGYDLNVAVNLSTLDLHDELLPDRVLHRLAEHHVPPHRLTFEITESALMSDTPRTLATIQHLEATGVSLSLDDFGTGYSSLSYLRQLPVTELKIDRSFVTNLLLDPHDEVIVRSTIDLGHNLGLTVVAEGIENEPVLHRLRTLGCDLAQGYGISRPLDPTLFKRWLATTNHHDQTPHTPTRHPQTRAQPRPRIRAPLHVINATVPMLRPSTSDATAGNTAGTN